MCESCAEMIDHNEPYLTDRDPGDETNAIYLADVHRWIVYPEGGIRVVFDPNAVGKVNTWPAGYVAMTVSPIDGRPTDFHIRAMLRMAEYFKLEFAS